jgi:hypothetical protein
VSTIITLSIPAGVTKSAWGTEYLPYYQVFVAAQTAAHRLGFGASARAQLDDALDSARGSDGNAIELKSAHALLEAFFGTTVALEDEVSADE